jgi:phosphate transport system protein
LKITTIGGDQDVRTIFHERMTHVVDHLVTMSGLVADMMGEATAALLTADLERAEACVSSDKAVNILQDATDESIIDLMTRQNPVATDMRSLVAAMRITTDVERMGDLAAHVAKVARRRYPDRAVPDSLVETFAGLGSKSQTIAEKTGLLLASHDVELCDQIKRDDDEIDRLHRSMFLVVLDHTWPGTAEQAVDLALLGRYYERFGDHAVLIASHVRYLITGSYERLGAPSR